MWSGCKPLVVNWTGGDPDSWVTLKLIQQVSRSSGGVEGVNLGNQVRARSGTMTLLPVHQSAGVQLPDCLSGAATWKYVHMFEAALVIP